MAQTVLTEGAELEPVISKKAKAQKEESQVNVPIEQEEVVNEEKVKKTVRSKRPNRNTQKKPRTTKKSTKQNEE